MFVPLYFLFFFGYTFQRRNIFSSGTGRIRNQHLLWLDQMYSFEITVGLDLFGGNNLSKLGGLDSDKLCINRRLLLIDGGDKKNDYGSCLQD